MDSNPGGVTKLFFPDAGAGLAPGNMTSGTPQYPDPLPVNFPYREGEHGVPPGWEGHWDQANGKPGWWPWLEV